MIVARLFGTLHRIVCHTYIKRAVLSGCFAVCLGACASLVKTPSDGVADDGFVFGADISALPVFEKHGAVYRYRGGIAGDAIRILADEGMNCYRLRLFVEPTEGGVVVNDLDYTLALARRVKAAGAKLMLDLHYSDTWADPAKQFKPKAWESLAFDKLLVKVQGYTRAVMQRFISEGVAPDYVQLGNEITNGMLWPEGRVEFAEAGDVAAWDRLAALQHAAHKGFVEGCGTHALPLVILHIESTGNLPRTTWYIEQAAARGVDYDILGFSFYPQWHGTIEGLGQTLNMAAKRTGKPVMVVETAYPWKSLSDWNEGAEYLRWPLSAKGQSDFMRAVTSTVRNVPNGQGLGVMWWFPESVLTKDLNVWKGGDCALFDQSGRPLPAAQSPTR